MDNTCSTAADEGWSSKTFLVALAHSVMLTRVLSTNEVGEFQVKCALYNSWRFCF